MKYAKISDSSWWNESVPTGFVGRTYTDENDQEQVYTWMQYLTQGNHLWRRLIYNDADELTAELAIFSRNGRPVSVPDGYSNAKIQFIDSNRYHYYLNPDESDFYLLYEYLDPDTYKSWKRKPVDIDFKRNVVETLYPKTVQYIGYTITTYYGDESQTIPILEEHDYTTHTHIYWYKMSGRDESYKLYKRSNIL